MRLRSRKATAPRTSAVARPAELQPGQGRGHLKHICSQKAPRRQGLFRLWSFSIDADDRSFKAATGVRSSVSRSSMALVEYACRGGAAHGACLSGSPRWNSTDASSLSCNPRANNLITARTCLLSLSLNDRLRLEPGPGGEHVPTRNSVCRSGQPGCEDSAVHAWYRHRS